MLKITMHHSFIETFHAYARSLKMSYDKCILLTLNLVQTGSKEVEMQRKQQREL